MFQEPELPISSLPRGASMNGRRAASGRAHQRLGLWLGSVALFFLCSVAVLVGSCMISQTRLVLKRASPDGAWIAAVRSYPEFDPPNQRISLRREDGPTQMVRQLGHDTQWCDQIAWSGNGSRVGFVINDSFLYLYSIPGADDLGRVRLLPEADLGRLVARRVVLSSDGTSASYKVCVENRALCFGRRRVSLNLGKNQ